MAVRRSLGKAFRSRLLFSGIPGMPLLVTTLLLLGAMVVVMPLLQERLATQLVERVLATQRRKVEDAAIRLNQSLAEKESGILRFAWLISSPDDGTIGGGDDLDRLVRRDPDGALRTPAKGFDAARQASLWIPPGVPLTPENRRFFVRAQEITRLFGMGAEDRLLVNSWVLPLTNGEVIYWPGNPSFAADAAASLDYRNTPWVQLTNPASNPGGGPRWTEPDYDPAAREWLISLVAPFERQGRWAGSVGHDMQVASLLNTLTDEQGESLLAMGVRSVATRPLYVVKGDGQLLARNGPVPAKGELLPFSYRSLLKGGNGEVSIHARGTDYLLVSSIPKLNVKVIYLVRGDWIRRNLREELSGLQFAQGLLLVVVVIAAVGLGLRELQHRRNEQMLLEARNRDLEKLVGERTRDLEAAHQRLQQEVLRASQIQRDLLVNERELQGLTPGLDAGALMVPSKEVGGDLYDCIALERDAYLFCVGDVAGKGMPAALLMSTCLSLLRSYAEVLDSPAAIMRRLNRRLCHNNEECSFTTMLIARLELRSGELRWCNAGHTPPLLLPSQGMPCYERRVHGPALGVVDELDYGESMLSMRSGDGLLLYTDGVSEFFDSQGRRFGLERLQERMAQLGRPSSRRLVRLLMRELRHFACGEDQHDDITMLLLRREGAATRAELRQDADDSARTTTPAFGGDSLSTALRLSIANDLTRLAEVKRPIEAFCQQQTISRPLQRKLMVVVDELLSNTIRYGCSHLGDQACISLELRADAVGLDLELRDNGTPPFNPLEASRPDLEGELDDRQIGGLGIHLVRSISSSFSYALEEGINVVRLHIERSSQG